MIDFDEAIKITRQLAVLTTVEEIDFRQGKGRVLAEDVYSDIDLPPFNKSAMDGYACRRIDLENILEVIEVIAAGSLPKKTVGPNQCSKIMTGAVLPDGADTVIIVENVEVVDNLHIRYNQMRTSPNICYRGEDLMKGEKIIGKGTILNSRHIPNLATVGKTKVKVFRQPEIGIIVTGSEIIEPWITLGKSQIRNSNAYSVLSLAADMDLRPHYFGICPDDEKTASKMLDEALKTCDIIIFSGAVSMGDFDFVPGLLKSYGVNIHFHGLHVKPGKRIIFGSNANQYFFGLPGNPVSVFIQFLFLVKPFLYNLMGADFETRYLKFPVKNDFIRKSGEKAEFLPVSLTSEGKIQISEYHGSAHINAYVEADGILYIPKGTVAINAGEPANIYLF